MNAAAWDASLARGRVAAVEVDNAAAPGAWDCGAARHHVCAQVHASAQDAAGQATAQKISFGMR